MNTRQTSLLLIFFLLCLLSETKATPPENLQTIQAALSQTNDPVEKGQLFQQLGQCYQKQGQLEAAAESYRNVVQIAKEIADARMEEKALQNLGALYLDTANLSTNQPFTAFTVLLILFFIAGIYYWANYREKSLQSMVFLQEQQLAKDGQEMERLNQRYEESQQFLKRDKEGIERNNKELIQTIKELKKFAFMATHDLKEPLRTIGSYASLINRRYKDKLDEDGQQFLDFITHGINRMHNLLSEVLHYAGLENSFKEKEMEWINTNDIVAELKKGLQSQIEEKQAVLVWKSDLPKVKADRNHLFQIFQNLISNGLKYNKSNQVQVEVESSLKGAFHLFCVSDNGIGLDMNFKHKIFEVFQRLERKEEYEGTGIGLAIVKKLIHFYGGEIWVESEIGKGSKFYFTIPVDPQKAMAPATQKATPAQSSL